MFREQDPWHDPKRMHQTYTNKPHVESQMSSALAHLDGQSGVKLATVQDLAPIAVPTTYDTVYDPEHPRSDWGGSVAVSEKAHYRGLRSMNTGIVQEENGIISQIERKEFASRRPSQGTRNMRNATPGLIGGIGPEDQFKTVAQSAAMRESTSRDQMTLSKQQLSQGKATLTNPAQLSRNNSNAPTKRISQQVQNRQFGENVRNEEEDAEYLEYLQSQGIKPEEHKPERESLVGYRAPPQTTSLLGGMSQKLDLSSFPDMPAPVVRRADQKNLSSTNRPIPGYTGYRQTPDL